MKWGLLFYFIGHAALYGQSVAWPNEDSVIQREHVWRVTKKYYSSLNELKSVGYATYNAAGKIVEEKIPIECKSDNETLGCVQHIKYNYSRQQQKSTIKYVENGAAVTQISYYKSKNFKDPIVDTILVNNKMNMVYRYHYNEDSVLIIGINGNRDTSLIIYRELGEDGNIVYQKRCWPITGFFETMEYQYYHGKPAYEIERNMLCRAKSNDTTSISAKRTDYSYNQDGQISTITGYRSLPPPLEWIWDWEYRLTYDLKGLIVCVEKYLLGGENLQWIYCGKQEFSYQYFEN